MPRTREYFAFKSVEKSVGKWEIQWESGKFGGKVGNSVGKWENDLDFCLAGHVRPTAETMAAYVH